MDQPPDERQACGGKQRPEPKLTPQDAAGCRDAAGKGAGTRSLDVIHGAAIGMDHAGREEHQHGLTRQESLLTVTKEIASQVGCTGVSAILSPHPRVDMVRVARTGCEPYGQRVMPTW